MKVTKEAWAGLVRNNKELGDEIVELRKIIASDANHVRQLERNQQTNSNLHYVIENEQLRAHNATLAKVVEYLISPIPTTTTIKETP